MKLSRGFLITIAVIVGAPIALALLSPMGSGNKKHCEALKHDLLTLSEMELEDKYNNSLNILTFPDGVVLGICEDSHSSFFGGNMAVKFDDATVLTYMGHVCGPRYLSMYKSEYENRGKQGDIGVNKSGFASFLKERLPNVGK
jgi:hypothetical protein